jgi:hypothetical protein
MKKLLVLLTFTTALFLMSCNNEKKDDKAKTDDPGKIENTVKETPKATLAVHTCTAGCTDGNHLLVHGEDGHTCAGACGTTHSCTAACKDGNHAYVHGELGHTCASADCAKM